MHASMQTWPLLVGRIIDHAARYHPNRKLITRSVEGPVTETTWSVVRDKALHVAQALASMGIGPGDTVGVMAWNTARMMEVWYGVPGAGAVLHTLNPRLFADQLVYIINHAENRVLMIDADLVPVIEGIRHRLETVRHFIVLTDADHMPETSLPEPICYEDWAMQVDADFDWVPVHETDPCGLCYTSGTTGNPKGVAYSHRSNTLHALSFVSPDMAGISSRDTVMPVVPLFHANGWSLGYSTPLSGASMVLPGRDLSAAALFEMLERGVTLTAAVPTIWLQLLAYLEAEGKAPSSLRRVIIGGSSCPRAVIEKFQRDYGVQVLHAWGMTEMSPLGTVCSFKPEVAALDPSGQLDIQETTGHPPFSVDLRIVDDAGAPQPWDGQTPGRLMARGDGVVSRYYKADAPAVDAENWFDTGDIATIDPNGYMAITDRSKDVIKSGGEWISSIELENAALDHPDVAEAAAIGVPHDKWGERPILVVVARPGAAQDAQGILETIARRCARWQVPDDVVFVDEIPHTATGKISKLHLRQRLSDMNYTLDP